VFSSLIEPNRGYAAGKRAESGRRSCSRSAQWPAEGTCCAWRLRGYGADRIIDHTAAPVTEAAGEQFDVVLNLVATSPEETAALTRLVRDGGVLVSTTTPAPEDPARRVAAVRVFARSDARQLAGLVDRVDAGTLRIDVAVRRPLAELAAVHDEAAQGRLAGKTVLLPA
jgi:NADPH:quinone reductase-like Zn-dependent oxidoreductase